MVKDSLQLDCKNTPRILVLDSDNQSASRIANFLRQAGFQVATRLGGLPGLENLLLFNPALVVLARRVPSDDGFNLLARIRQNTKTLPLPIIFMCEQDDETDQVVAFRLGANDVVVKPIKPAVLLARIRIQLGMERLATNSQSDHPDRFLQLGDLLIDFSRSEAMLAGLPLPLTPSEFLLLAGLAKNHPSTLSRAELAVAIGRQPQGRPWRLVDTHIKTLRRKLARHGFIQTVRAKGYRINPPNCLPPPSSS